MIMSLKTILWQLAAVMMIVSSGSVYAIERLFWDKVPLRITLPINKERMITFPADVRVGIPGRVSAKLRTQSNQGTIYWKASDSFDTQRIEVQEIKSKRIYLIDLRASKKANSVTPIEVIFKNHQKNESDTHKKPNSKSTVKLGYIGLTRYAAQQLFAPSRLLKASVNIHRISVAKQSTRHLIRGEAILATPVASWQSGSLYVTAVELKNIGEQSINLDPRKIRGEWHTATFHYSRLHPAGTEADTTAVYLISDRPYHEMVI